MFTIQCNPSLAYIATLYILSEAKKPTDKRRQDKVILGVAKLIINTAMSRQDILCIQSKVSLILFKMRHIPVTDLFPVHPEVSPVERLASSGLSLHLL